MTEEIKEAIIEPNAELSIEKRSELFAAELTVLIKKYDIGLNITLIDLKK